MPGKSKRPPRGRSPAARASGLATVGEESGPADDAAHEPAPVSAPKPKRAPSKACPIPEPKFMLEPTLFGEMRVAAETLPEGKEDREVISKFVMGMECVAYARKTYPAERTAWLRDSIARNTRELHDLVGPWLRGSAEPLEDWVVQLGAVRFVPDVSRREWIKVLKDFEEKDSYRHRMHSKLRSPSRPSGQAGGGDGDGGDDGPASAATRAAAAAPFHALDPFAQAVERNVSTRAPSMEMLADAIRAAAEDLRDFAAAAIEDAAKPPAKRRREPAPAESGGGGAGDDRRTRRPRCTLPAARSCPKVQDVFRKAVKAKLSEARRGARFDVAFCASPPGLGKGPGRKLSPKEYADAIPVASPTMHRLALRILFDRAVVEHVEKRRVAHAKKGYAMVEAAQGPLFEYMKRNRLQRQRIAIRVRSSKSEEDAFRPVDIVLAAKVGTLLPQRPAMRMSWAWKALDELMGEAADVFSAPLTRDSIESLAGAVRTRVDAIGTRVCRGFEDILDEYYMDRDDRLVGIFGADALDSATVPPSLSVPEGEQEAKAEDRAATRTSRATARSRAANSLIGVPGVVPKCDVPVVLRLVEVKPREPPAPRPRDHQRAPASESRAPPAPEWDAPFSW